MVDGPSSVTAPALRLVQPEPALRWPERPERFPMARLAAIAAVDSKTIERWTYRGSIKFRRVGTGKLRAYRLDEALHLAVIAEMSRLGLSITCSGAMLSAAVAEWIELHLRRDSDVRRLPSIALAPVEDGRDFEMIEDIARATGSGSCVVIGTRWIAEGVLQRFLAP